MKIKIIYDNCKASEDFQEGWGFSCLVDLGHRKILFDTGADKEAFFSNLAKMGARCAEFTDVVYSHKHGDHIAGLEVILAQLKQGTRLFVPKKFPIKTVPASICCEIVDDFKEIDSRIYSLVLKGGFLLYEQALIIETKNGLVVITGCAHPGIIHLLQEVKKRLDQPIHLVLGGFHLFRKRQGTIDAIVQGFKDLNVQLAAPCHCTGPLAIERFKRVYQNRFYPIGSGATLILD